MYNATVLQSVICPIVSYAENVNVCVQKFFGTGFFFNTEGFFLTTRSIVEEGINYANRENLKLGISPILDDFTKFNISYEQLAFPILKYEFAPHPFDIALCKTDYEVNTWLKLEQSEVKTEQEVSLLGYFSSDLGNENESSILPRFYNGKIKRIIAENNPNYDNALSLFEPSFPLRYGLSGCPFFISSNDSTIVIGVSIDSVRLRRKDHRTINFNAEKLGTEKPENDLKKYFGIVQDIRSLLDWKPKILGGKTLSELSTNFLK